MDSRTSIIPTAKSNCLLEKVQIMIMMLKGELEMVSLCLIVHLLAAVHQLESEDIHFGEMIQTNSQETYLFRFK